MQHIVGAIQKDYKRLVRAFDKSIVANFPSHVVELGENTCNSLATGYHDQSQPLYGMPIDTYPKQPQPPTHIDNKLADLHISGPSAREHGPSGLAMVGPIFNELPKYVSEPPHATQSLNYPVGPSAYSDGRSAYDHGRSGHMAGQFAHTVGRSAYLTGRSSTWLVEEDCYLNPHPSQQHFPSHYTMHQPINTSSQAHGTSTFRLRLEDRKGAVSPMNHIGQIEREIGLTISYNRFWWLTVTPRILQLNFFFSLLAKIRALPFPFRFPLAKP
jgi:hypothetical protein